MHRYIFEDEWLLALMDFYRYVVRRHHIYNNYKECICSRDISMLEQETQIKPQHSFKGQLQS